MSSVHKLLYTEEAKKRIDKLSDARLRARIKEALEQIAQNPTIGKPLTRELKGRFSYRVSVYRIIYRVIREQVIVLILTIGHRREVYGQASRKQA